MISVVCMYIRDRTEELKLGKIKRMTRRKGMNEVGEKSLLIQRMREDARNGVKDFAFVRKGRTGRGSLSRGKWKGVPESTCPRKVQVQGDRVTTWKAW